MEIVNFIEAINSGKRFRLQGDTEWFKFKDGFFRNGKHKFAPCLSVINSQFELEEKQITITENRIDEILSLVTYAQESKDLIKRQLGF